MATLHATFKSWSKLVKFLLLVIPGVNEIVEIILHASIMFNKFTALNLIVFILCFPLGIIIGWIDAVMVLLDKDLILCE